MRARSLRTAGHSPHYQALAVEAGELKRVGHGWLAVPDIDPELEAAAEDGVVLTCITEARRLGLWILQSDGKVHVGTTSHGRAPAGSPRHHVHWSRPVVPRHPDALVDPIENVLALVAYCLPHDEALAIWESALNKGLVSAEVLRGLSFGPAARGLRDECTPWSDSGLESFVTPRLRFLRLRIVPQVWIADHRVDFLIGDRLVLQIDGATHAGEQRDVDNYHDALLKLMGYHVIRVGYHQVVDRWHEVQDLLMRAVAQGLHHDRGRGGSH